MDYIKKIRAVRTDKGYSQEFMALQLHICQQAYCRIERGHTDITISRLLEIANILEVKAWTFLK